MAYIYGNKNDEIDEFFEAKRPWSAVKDEIVAKYISCYLKTVQGRNRPILIVDAFAGPGRFGDGTAGSPLIILDEVTKTPVRKVGISALFADVRPAHRAALERNLATFIAAGAAEPPLKDCATVLARALEVGRDRTIFFYLDPYGIRDLDFEMVKQICVRSPQQSTEVLINFNFRAFMRMSGNWSYGDSASDVAIQVKASKIDTVNKVMGGDYWFPIVTDPTLDKVQREDAVVAAYIGRVREFFRFVVSIPVKDKLDEPGSLEDDLAKYHLIFGTRSAKAVVFMNDVGYNALEPYFSRFKDGLLFPVTPERYEVRGREETKDMIVAAASVRAMRRPELMETIVPGHFMQYKTKHYRELIDELVFKDGRLFADPRTIKKKHMLNDETLLATTAWSGGKSP